MTKQKGHDHDEAQARAFPLSFGGPQSFGGREALSTLSRASEAWVQTCVDLQRELAAFASSRFKSDVELATAMARCPNAVELARLQQDWAATAFRDYAHETGQLVQVASDAIVNGAAATREATARAGETIVSARSAD